MFTQETLQMQSYHAKRQTYLACIIYRQQIDQVELDYHRLNN